MSKYFHIMTGLRGCYMPDNAYVIRVDTRRELKAAIEDEARLCRDSGFVGGSKSAVASLAAAAWREAHKRNPSIYPHVAPYGSRDNRHSAIHVSTATRAEYLEFESA
ncbi:hypothetical protein EN759_00540 [Mesorhizobium sp. M00.F.Ca.ET.038.03.1.1]|nr:hypothetical protein EN759_00540 [Mesorhizobium sp. M00.F.Ca.ET.038.03.1.1]TIW02008.1 MAG: hypothetical protein E5V77_07145 [Mesorhizobium sp.]